MILINKETRSAEIHDAKISRDFRKIRSLPTGQIGALDLLLASTIAICWCAYLPIYFSWFWVPRMVVVLVASIPGLLALSVLAARGQVAARLGLGFLAWVLVSGLVSDSIRLSVLGAAGQEVHVVGYVAAVGLWALAQFITDAGRWLLSVVLLAVISLNAAAGAFQMLFQVNGVDLGLSGGRAVGLTPNPIFLASMMLVGIFVVLFGIDQASPRGVWCSTGALLVFGVVLAFTATRVALIAFVVVSIGVLVLQWHRLRTVGVVVATFGVVVGTALARALGTASDALSRSTTLQSGGRIAWWEGGMRALFEHPVFGWGPGRFRTALQGNYSFASIAASGDSQSMPDAHNIVVTILVAVGIPGFILFVAFAYAVVRRAQGVYCSALAAVLIVWLLQPAGLVTLLPFMVLLGVSMVATSHVERSSPADMSDEAGERGLPFTPWIWATATIVGLFAASWLLIADYRLAEAAKANDGEAFAAVEWMYLGDPIISDIGATIWVRQSLVDPAAAEQVIPQLKRSVNLEPTRAYWHARLALAYAADRNYGDSILSARRALELQPTSELAWTTLLSVAEQTNDHGLRVEAMEAVCLLELDLCDRGR